MDQKQEQTQHYDDFMQVYEGVKPYIEEEKKDFDDVTWALKIEQTNVVIREFMRTNLHSSRIGAILDMSIKCAIAEESETSSIILFACITDADIQELKNNDFKLKLLP